MYASELTLVLFASLSAVASASIVVTGLVFTSMMTRPFMQIIMLIAFSDSIGSIFAALGFPPNGSAECSVQSFFNAFFYKASWLWILMLCHQMYHYVSRGKFGLNKVQMHVVCWLIPLLTTILPLSELSYGTDDQQQGAYWCFLTDGTSKSTLTDIWILVTFDLVLLLALGWVVYYVIRISYKYRYVQNNAKVTAIVQSLYFYPLSLLLAWLPNLIYFTFIENFSTKTSNFYANSAITILSTQNGTFTAVIFFISSKEARSRWSFAFKHLTTCFKDLPPPKSGDSIQVYYLQDNDVDNTVFQRNRPADGEWQGSDYIESDRSSERTDSISMSKLSSENGYGSNMANKVQAGHGKGVNSTLNKANYNVSSSPGKTNSFGVSPTGQPIPILSSTPSSYARSSLFNRSPIQSYLSSKTEVGSYFNKSNSGITQQASSNSVKNEGDNPTNANSLAASVDCEKGLASSSTSDKSDQLRLETIPHTPSRVSQVSMGSHSLSNVSDIEADDVIFNPVGRMTTAEFEQITQLSSQFK
jgi:hypothetical protein